MRFIASLCLITLGIAAGCGRSSADHAMRTGWSAYGEARVVDEQVSILTTLGDQAGNEITIEGWIGQVDQDNGQWMRIRDKWGGEVFAEVRNEEFILPGNARGRKVIAHGVPLVSIRTAEERRKLLADAGASASILASIDQGSTKTAIIIDGVWIQGEGLTLPNDVEKRPTRSARTKPTPSKSNEPRRAPTTTAVARVPLKVSQQPNPAVPIDVDKITSPTIVLPAPFGSVVSVGAPTMREEILVTRRPVVPTEPVAPAKPVEPILAITEPEEFEGVISEPIELVEVVEPIELEPMNVEVVEVLEVLEVEPMNVEVVEILEVEPMNAEVDEVVEVVEVLEVLEVEPMNVEVVEILEVEPMNAEVDEVVEVLEVLEVEPMNVEVVEILEVEPMNAEVVEVAEPVEPEIRIDPDMIPEPSEREEIVIVVPEPSRRIVETDFPELSVVETDVEGVATRADNSRSLGTLNVHDPQSAMTRSNNQLPSKSTSQSRSEDSLLVIEAREVQASPVPSDALIEERTNTPLLPEPARTLPVPLSQLTVASEAIREPEINVVPMMIDEPTSKNSEVRANIDAIEELEVFEPEVIEPEFIEPEFVEPEFIEPEVIEPEVVEPEVIEPEVIEPEVIEPEVIEPEVVEPEVVEPEFVEPEFVEPVIEELPVPRDIQNTSETPSLIDELLNEPVVEEPLPLFNPNSSRASEITMIPMDNPTSESSAAHEPGDEFAPTQTDSPVRHTSVEEWTLLEEFGEPKTPLQTDTTKPITPPDDVFAPAVTEPEPEPVFKPQTTEDALPEAVKPITPPDDVFAPAVIEPEPEPVFKPQTTEDALPEAVKPITPPDDVFAPAVTEPEPQTTEDALPEAVKPITPPDDAFAPAVTEPEPEPVKATASATSQAGETKVATPPGKTIHIEASMLNVEDVTLTPATIDDGEKN